VIRKKESRLDLPSTKTTGSWFLWKQSTMFLHGSVEKHQQNKRRGGGGAPQYISSDFLLVEKDLSQKQKRINEWKPYYWAGKALSEGGWLFNLGVLTSILTGEKRKKKLINTNREGGISAPAVSPDVKRWEVKSNFMSKDDCPTRMEKG